MQDPQFPERGRASSQDHDQDPELAEPEATAFGRSLHLDLYGVDRGLCDDLDFCYRFLDELTDWLGMHKQSPPYIFRSPDKEFPDKAGLSGWVPLIESGISVHTLTVTGFVSVDIYTCGPLDVDASLEFVTRRFGPARSEHNYLVRGKRYHA